MKKLVALGLLSAAFVVPAMAAKHTISHPKAVHATNPYIKHPNHKAHRGHHKKI